MGKAGEFTVEVLGRPDVGWQLSVESSNWCFAFNMDRPCAVAELANFLRSNAGREEFAELTVGSFGGASVRVVKDDEFAERFFLRASDGGLLVEFELIGGIMREFAVAVAEAAAEFGAEAESGAAAEGGNTLPSSTPEK
jgi:hypothetical protein